MASGYYDSDFEYASVLARARECGISIVDDAGANNIAGGDRDDQSTASTIAGGGRRDSKRKWGGHLVSPEDGGCERNSWLRSTAAWAG